MKNTLINCPKCKKAFPLGSHPAGGMWKCPHCDHSFKASTRDVVNQGDTKDRFPLFSLIIMTVFITSLLFGFSMAGNIQVDNYKSLPCIPQKVICLGEKILDYSWEVWGSSFVGIVFLWLFLIRFLKGTKRVIFNLGLLLFYFVLMSFVIGTTLYLSNCVSCPFNL